MSNIVFLAYNCSMALVITVLAVCIFLIAAEWRWHKQKVHDEFSRKLIHITVGTFVAFWPFFLSWGQIIFLSGAFLVVITLSKYLNIFKSIHNVQRPTWGEIFFALAVGIVAVLTHDKWIYMASLLQMSWADGFAAVAGVAYGKDTRYKILGYTKSLVGSGTFFAISVCILSLYAALSGNMLTPFTIVGLALVATIVENFGTHGIDNLLVPIVVAIALQQI